MMAEVLPSDGTVTTCDFDPYVSEMARRLLDQTPQGNKIKMILGNIVPIRYGIIYTQNLH